jgi:hypothetical protein
MFNLLISLWEDIEGMVRLPHVDRAVARSGIK